jgi:hypothetical protein
MHLRAIVLLAAALCGSQALAQQRRAAPAKPPASASAINESRDAATAYVGTGNFIVGRIGRDCLSLLDRKQTPQQFVAAWQQRNARYVLAAAKYMELRLQQAMAHGGAPERDAMLAEITEIARSKAEPLVRSWLGTGTPEEACKKSLELVDAGALDFNAGAPMFNELEALAKWAAQ